MSITQAGSVCLVSLIAVTNTSIRRSLTCVALSGAVSIVYRSRARRRVRSTTPSLITGDPIIKIPQVTHGTSIRVLGSSTARYNTVRRSVDETFKPRFSSLFINMSAYTTEGCFDFIDPKKILIATRRSDPPVLGTKLSSFMLMRFEFIPPLKIVRYLGHIWKVLGPAGRLR